jgi:hypothetical protein
MGVNRRNTSPVFVWQRPDGLSRCINRSCSRIQTSAVLNPPQTLSASGQDAFKPQVGVIDVNGYTDSVFVWERGGLIQARTRSGDGVLGTIQTLSNPGHSADGPQVGVNQSGKAVAVWWRFDGTNNRIQAATGP